MQRETPRESDTTSRREEACLLNLCYVVAQQVTSQPDTVDMTVTYFSAHRRLELKSDPRRKQFSSLCTAHFAPVLRRFPLLHGSGAGIPGIGILIYSWYCGIGISSGDGIYSRTRDAETST